LAGKLDQFSAFTLTVGPAGAGPVDSEQ